MTTNIKSKQLEILLHEFELISKTALTQIQIVSKIMQDHSLAESLYNEVKTNEMIIDRLEIKIREEVVFTIFQFNPVAADLRQIISYLELTTNLERVGDMLLNVTQHIRETDMSATEHNGIKTKMSKMLSYTHEMLRDAILSFSNSDTKVAYRVIENDNKVDALYHEIKLSLQDIYSKRQPSAKDIQALLSIESIAHNLERVGDSATNIAEAAIYLTDGKDIRHGNEE